MVHDWGNRASACCSSRELRESNIRTLIIIPAFNEAESLPDVLASLKSQMPSCDIVVVDDGSTDATAEVVRAARVPVLVLPYNLGIGGALRTGFRYAVDHDYDRAVQFDADGQHDAAAIPVLLEALEDSDFVIGSRFAEQSHYEVSRARRGAMHILRLTLRALSGRSFTDTSSGFRAFNRDMLEFFARNYPAEYMESVEALLTATLAGFRVVEVPVKMHARQSGSASNGRLRLAYHYSRLFVALISAARLRRAEDKLQPSPTREAMSEGPAMSEGSK